MTDLRYNLGWLIVAALLGWGTGWLIRNAPEGSFEDRREPGVEGPQTPQSIQATQVEIQEVDPITNEVRWELKVPETAGGPAGASSFASPEITLYPGSNGFKIRATAATLDKAPDGQTHSAGNATLELTGPIAGESADGLQSFTADHATWVGEKTQLTLTGNPLTLNRGNLEVEAQRLVVSFFPDKPPQYDLSGDVQVRGGLP